MRSASALPLPVKRALAKLGGDIRAARLRRRISATLMAERVSITRVTLQNAERGDSGVAIGTYVTILFVLGLIARLNDLIDVRHDDVGLQLEEECLPRRIRRTRKTNKGAR